VTQYRSVLLVGLMSSIAENNLIMFMLDVKGSGDK
jgi:hypothetical protein